jgi:hypothetical protein
LEKSRRSISFLINVLKYLNIKGFGFHEQY